MRAICRVLSVLAVAAAIAGCARDKQWMKVGEPYTTAEFRRDYAECSKPKGSLDEDCLRARGWVDMSPSKGDRAADNPPPPPENYRQRSTLPVR
jgi:hypothetical protein